MNKLRKQPALNLVSLMDIFTILVFFLLVSSSSSQQLPSSKDVRLPTSTTKSMPEETLVLMVTSDDILVEGVSVAKIVSVNQNSDKVIKSLKSELDFHASKKNISGNKLNSEMQGGFAVTIVGDENIPYELLSKILTTCRHANFTRIAFLANQKAKS
ncbi:biopolymer transporter ExbD [Aliikangiella sp. G2MR2-5]|uniref:ExbD/TolR family protein n=1 Tax=Aliikangiella sp. G2MR2-5 TaxID=2788943 RepID=UPI001AEEBCFF|nr:biopolymer transporter ExbD [Aliikangiella sp. G2MR2-5]